VNLDKVYDPKTANQPSEIAEIHYLSDRLVVNGRKVTCAIQPKFFLR
jgi:hypothetical protein